MPRPQMNPANRDDWHRYLDVTTIEGARRREQEYYDRGTADGHRPKVKYRPRIIPQMQPGADRSGPHQAPKKPRQPCVHTPTTMHMTATGRICWKKGG